MRTGDTDGDGKDEIVILKGDRYRIYTEPDVGSQATETTGSFYAPSSFYNRQRQQSAVHGARQRGWPGVPSGPIAQCHSYLTELQPRLR